MEFSFFSNIEPAVRTVLMVVLLILIFFTIIFHIWKFIKNDSFVRLMLTRTYSWWGIFFIYIVFFCVYRPIGHMGLCIVSLLGFNEIIKNSSFLNLSKKLIWICNLVIILQFIATSLLSSNISLAVIPFLGTILVTIFCILFESVETTVQAPPFLIWTLILTSSGFAHLNYLFSLESNPQTLNFGSHGLLVYFLFLTQFNDVLQFIWGTVFGKRFISPVISPKKTWEGLVGAIFTTMFIAYFLRFITPFNEWQSLLIGFILPLFGFWGDLTISSLKRHLKVKDLGTIIPGHGGVLDRVDSILLSSIVYFYLIYFWFIF
jgi:phosphatidate cytidylyltransferase